jgi:Glyoxalase superfamily protein
MSFALDTPTASSLKDEAKALRDERDKAGTPLGHSAALEEIARRHGYRDWNTARAALPDRIPVPVQVGDRVTGAYLKQPFAGTVLAVKALADMRHFEVTVNFDEPVDVITFESWSSFRQRVTTTVDVHGVSPAKTSDGEPHMWLKRTPR